MSVDGTAIAASVRTGRETAVAVAQASLDRITKLNPLLNAFTAVLADQALEAAAAIDRKVCAGEDPGPLAGVPFAAKNLFDIAGLTTVAGSKILREAPKATRDAVIVARLKAAGAVLVGATNMDEFAYGFTTENAHDGPTRNPRDPARSAGGSSGGSAAAVAGGLVPVSLGSDTNGSIRVPASLCGIFGLKPTFGRLPRDGTFPFVHELDHVGPFARTARDLALTYDLLQDPPSAEPALPSLGRPLDGLRFAVLDGWFRDGAAEDAIEAVDTVAVALGAERRVTLKGVAEARAAAFCLTAASGAALHLPSLQTRPADFDPATRDRLLAGAMLPAAVLSRARQLRHWFKDQLEDLFREVDLLLAPATPITAPLLGQATFGLGDRDLPVRANLGLYTQPISFAGLPVVAAPVSRPGRPPIGVQIIAAPRREAVALRTAAWLERQGVVGTDYGDP